MPTRLTAELLYSLGVALNEAQFCDLIIKPDTAEGWVLFQVLTLPETGPVPADRRLLLHLKQIGRLAASLRTNRWDDLDTRVEPLRLDQLRETVQSFRGQPIYGWEFFDNPTWNSSNRLSLDEQWIGGSVQHSLNLFQEWGTERFLDLKIWFGDMDAYSHDRKPMNLEDVAAGGRRWWDAFHHGDPRTAQHGMVPACEWLAQSWHPPLKIQDTDT